MQKRGITGLTTDGTKNPITSVPIQDKTPSITALESIISGDFSVVSFSEMP